MYYSGVKRKLDFDRAKSEKKSEYTCKPDSVPRQSGTSVIYLSCLPLLMNFRSRTSHSFPKGFRIYMAFQPVRFIRYRHYCRYPGALTSRFHPYPCTKTGAVLFCDTFCIPPSRNPIRYVARCSTLSGLSSSLMYQGRDRAVYSPRRYIFLVILPTGRPDIPCAWARNTLSYGK